MLLIRAILDRSLACLFATVVDDKRRGWFPIAVVCILWALRSASRAVVVLLRLPLGLSGGQLHFAAEPRAQALVLQGG